LEHVTATPRTALAEIPAERIGWQEGDRGMSLADKDGRAVGNAVILPGPDAFSVTVFPVCSFVNETFKALVVRKIIDPSEALSTLVSSLMAGTALTLNPQYTAGTVPGSAGSSSHLWPRPASARGRCQHPGEHAQQRAERHDHAKSPHDDHTPTPIRARSGC